MATIELPYNFKARPYQKEVLDAIDKYNRMCIIWHRRGWKDKTMFQALLMKALKRKWVYYYIFPEYEQGRKIFWDGIDNDWLKMIDHIPKEILKSTNDQQMKIELMNGSLIQVVGTDRKINNIVGTNPVWCIFSEYSISNPLWWDLIRPIIKMNGGFVWFVYTPRGKNHWYDLKEVARKNPEDWFLSVKTASETTDNEWNRIISDEMIEQERRDWMDEDLLQQEYFCSFEAAIKGAYFAEQLRLARLENRISKVPYEPLLDVYTFWDLWMNDTTAIWFVQFHWKEIRLIDHYEMSWESLDHYVTVLKSKPYKYTPLYLPHDAEVRELSTWSTRKEFFERAWFRVEIVPKLSIEDGISAVRQVFKNCWFDENKCERWINALWSYHKDFDEKNRVYRNSPKHDWASNSADAFRYMWVMYESLVNDTTDYRAMDSEDFF